MSSNQYGFTCVVPFGDRRFDVQVVYEGTCDDSEDTLLEATADWESTEPADLAEYELRHRDWSNPHAACRVRVWGCYGGWLPDDPTNVLWSPPQPEEREVLQAIASGLATDFVHGWDT